MLKFSITPTKQKRTGPRTDAPKTAPFSRVGGYNRDTTRKPVGRQQE